MVRLQDRQSFLSTFIKPTFVVLLLAYFIFHTFNGNHGVYAYLKERHKQSVQEEELAKLHSQHRELSHRVQHIGGESLDVDLLDEEVRKTLGYAKPSEVILLLPRNES